MNLIRKILGMPWYGWVILALMTANGGQSMAMRWKTRTIHKLETQIVEQNASIAAYQAAGERQTDRIADAVDASEQVKIVYVDRVKRLAAATVPTECAAAVGWLVREAPRLGAY